MSGCMVTPDSPKYGYEFDGQEHDVRRSAKERRCQGGHGSRGGGEGRHTEGCTGMIRKGDTMCCTLIAPYMGETFACIPCALAARAVRAC